MVYYGESEERVNLLLLQEEGGGSSSLIQPDGATEIPETAHQISTGSFFLFFFSYTLRGRHEVHVICTPPSISLDQRPFIVILVLIVVNIIDPSGIF